MSKEASGISPAYRTNAGGVCYVSLLNHLSQPLYRALEPHGWLRLCCTAADVDLLSGHERTEIRRMVRGTTSFSSVRSITWLLAAGTHIAHRTHLSQCMLGQVRRIGSDQTDADIPSAPSYTTSTDAIGRCPWISITLTREVAHAIRLYPVDHVACGHCNMPAIIDAISL